MPPAGSFLKKAAQKLLTGYSFFYGRRNDDLYNGFYATIRAHFVHARRTLRSMRMRTLRWCATEKADLQARIYHYSL